MSKSQQDIVCQGWLTKSPPSKRIWRAKWRRRWFALLQSGELPGQYILNYYADRNCSRYKGTIYLDQCEQVDAGLHMERRGTNTSLGPKLRGSVFSVRTQARVYHLEADCEADMVKWVDAICRVCGLRSTDDTADTISKFENEFNAADKESDSSDNTGPYIPISECITGMRMTKIVPSKPVQEKKVEKVKSANSTDDSSEEERRLVSVSRSKAISGKQKNVSKNVSTGRLVGKSFTKSTKPNNGFNEGPPVPPRPPKSIIIKDGMYSDMKKKCSEPIFIRGRVGALPRSPVRDYNNAASPIRRYTNAGSPTKGYTNTASPTRGCNNTASPTRGYTNTASPTRGYSNTASPTRGYSNAASPTRGYTNTLSPKRGYVNTLAPMRGYANTLSPTRDYANTLAPFDYRGTGAIPKNATHEDFSITSDAFYSNCLQPPAVDRALKPRPSSHSTGQIHTLYNNSQGIFGKGLQRKNDYNKAALQYLDLDLHGSKPGQSRSEALRMGVSHGKSQSAVEADDSYRVVDFVKTDAFNTMRQDAEASRRKAMAL